MSLFSADGITAGYNGKTIVRNISFTVENGRLTGILGANGSGKTTLLKAICGIVPHSGECVLNGESLNSLSVRQLARRCSYIPQRSGISIDISALDTVLMGFNPRMKILERPDRAMKSDARKALERVGLAGRENTNYQHLSEGQKQLCILARTLVADSRLLLLDEPESSLDFQFRYRILNIIRSWLGEGDRCAVVTLHDPSLALNFCDELLLLSEGVLLGTIRPKTDSLDKMEETLKHIYGNLSLLRCRNRSGQEQLVMLKE